jgi:hypothetical protein
MTDATDVISIKASLPASLAFPTAPTLILNAGPAAAFAWEEFFSASIRNAHTRAAYAPAVRRFFAWLEPRNLRVEQITPGIVGQYFAQHPGSPPTRKLHLAALRVP